MRLIPVPKEISVALETHLLKSTQAKLLTLRYLD